MVAVQHKRCIIILQFYTREMVLDDEKFNYLQANQGLRDDDEMNDCKMKSSWVLCMKAVSQIAIYKFITRKRMFSI